MSILIIEIEHFILISRFQSLLVDSRTEIASASALIQFNDPCVNYLCLITSKIASYLICKLKQDNAEKHMN